METNSTHDFRPYYCEKCGEFFKIKNEYAEHAEKQHPGDLPKDLASLVPPPGSENDSQIDSLGDIQIETIETEAPEETNQEAEAESAEVVNAPSTTQVYFFSFLICAVYQLRLNNSDKFDKIIFR